ncbi:phosphoglycerate kinase [Candidatus Atribacteria bacterium HGW-Atribacteria-1]|nr:MAG: phosphoglycerate kinase [Candidatus Atribacteria bacterium HGW-Atribacteria-1]
MINGMYTLDDFNLKGKIVLARFDMNSPLDPKTREPIDITRIKESLPTLKELTEKGAKTVILIHQGSDIEYHNYSSTELHARVIAQLLEMPVSYIDDVCGPAARDKIKTLKNSQILMLENVRFMAEEMTLFETKLNLTPEEQAKTLVVCKLAPLADLYICDAFAAAHRSQPTLVGMEEVLPSAMGRLLEKEITSLNQLLKNPDKPCIFILGGAKIQDAFLMIDSILKNNIADLVLATGLVAQAILLAKGISLGKPSEDLIKKKNLESYIDQSKAILKTFAKQIKLPIDFAYSLSGERKEVKVSSLPINYTLMDLGKDTISEYESIIKDAKTIFFNGPAGVFEKKETELGTKSILSAIAKSNAFSVIGGGDSIAAVNKYNLSNNISYISTGGGALVRFLSGEELPVVKALKKSAKKFPCDR